MRASLARVSRWALDSEGSTRSVALIRMGLALIIWTRFGAQVALYWNPHLWRLFLACAFTPAVTLMFLGVWTRVCTLASAGIIGAMYAYARMFPHRSEWGHHHVYLLVAATLLCALAPAEKSFSVERWLAVRRARLAAAEPPEERGNLWAQRLIAFQVAAVYFWAAVDKTHTGYFSGANLEQAFMDQYFGSQYPDWFPGFHVLCLAASWLTLLIEYGLAFGLFVPRLRLACILVGVLFHAVIYLTLPVKTFSVTMIVLYLAFLDPDAVHRTIDQLLSGRKTQITGSSLEKSA